MGFDTFDVNVRFLKERRGEDKKRFLRLAKKWERDYTDIFVITFNKVYI